jgi:hypothetical protein
MLPLAAILVIVTLLGAVGCNSSPNVVGKFHLSHTENTDGVLLGIPSINLEFSKDGTFVLDNLDIGDQGGIPAGTVSLGMGEGGIPAGSSGSGTYSFPDNTHIKFHGQAGSNTYVFSFSKYGFTLTEPNGILHEFESDK